jgi:hypothetical protein
VLNLCGVVAQQQPNDDICIGALQPYFFQLAKIADRLRMSSTATARPE